MDLPGLPPELHARELDAYGTQLNDVVLQLAPWEREVRRALGERRLPFWSDTLDGGSNLWGNPQAGVLSPVALAARLLPWRDFLLAGLALKLSIAFSGAVLLARRLGTRAPAALLAALAFALGGAIFAWALFPLSTAVAWVPWWSAALLRLLRRPSARALAATASTGAALLLSGHPEVAFAGVLFALALAALLRRRARGAPRRAAAALLGCVLAAGLAAPGWLPFLLLVPDSQRLQERLAPAAGAPSQTRGARIDSYAAELRPFLAATLDGNAFGRPFNGVGTLWPVSMMPFSSRGAVLLALAGFTVARRGRRRLHAALLLLWLGLVLVAPRIDAPGLLAVPAMNRFLPIGDLALALAAALGIDALTRAAARRRVGPRLAATAGLLAALGAVLAPAPGAASRAALWLPVGALAFWAVAPRRGGSRPSRLAAAWPLLLWTAVELVLWNRTLLPRGDARLFFPETALIRQVAALADADQAPRSPAPRHRAVGLDQLVPASLLPAYGIGDIRPHNPLAPASVLRSLRVAFGFAPDPQRYFGTMGSLDHPLLSFLDIGPVVSNAWLPTPARLASVALEAPQPVHPSMVPDVLWREPDSVGRLFLAKAVDSVEPGELETWLSHMRDPRRVAIEPAAAKAAAVGSFDPRDLRILRWRSGDIELIAGGSGSRLLASSLPGPLGWHASDRTGSRLRTVRIDGAYLGVPLPAGVDAIRLRFRPPGVVAGAAMAAGSLLVLAAAWAHRGRRRSARALPQGLAGSEYSNT